MEKEARKYFLKFNSLGLGEVVLTKIILTGVLTILDSSATTTQSCIALLYFSARTSSSSDNRTVDCARRRLSGGGVAVLRHR